MYQIFLKEIRGFLSSFVAYIVISVFLTAIGLFIWVFPETNTLDAGYANLDTLFFMGPWIFIFLISAITMRAFSEEKRQGTIETLTTAPISDMAIITGKYFAGVVLVLFSILPTALYYLTVYQLGAVTGNIDSGATLGSYFGLLMLGSAFVAIGLFASVISENQIVSFVVSMFICFIFYMGFEFLADLRLFPGLDLILQNLGIYTHYQSVSRGVLDTRDVVYFVSLSVFFLFLTKAIFGSRRW